MRGRFLAALALAVIEETLTVFGGTVAEHYGRAVGRVLGRKLVQTQQKPSHDRKRKKRNAASHSPVDGMEAGDEQ